MPLKCGESLRSEIWEEDLQVVSMLGQGTQGVVYKVSCPRGVLAVKWYNAAYSTPAQREAILELVKRTPPDERGGGANNSTSPSAVSSTRFVWPLDLVTSPSSKSFGYLMSLIDTSRFTGLGRIQGGHVAPPSYPTLCRLSHNLANSYQALHLDGLCYRDISDGNVMLDPETGDVLICDNDNVGVAGVSDSQVWGTMDFMAPEVILKKQKPSAASDLHSLAVLFFNFWVWHNPYHGVKEAQIRSLDVPAKRLLYGEQPVFIAHPTDASNRLPESDPRYETARRMWRAVPPSLKQLFTVAFSDGALSPNKRIREGQWAHLFEELSDNATKCPQCGVANLWDHLMPHLDCWKCGRQSPVTRHLVVTHGFGKTHILAANGKVLLRRHVSPNPPYGRCDEKLGEIVSHPQAPQLRGLRNETKQAWSCSFEKGPSMNIEPGKSAPIQPGLRLTVENAVIEVAG